MNVLRKRNLYATIIALSFVALMYNSQTLLSGTLLEYSEEQDQLNKTDSDINSLNTPTKMPAVLSSSLINSSSKRTNNPCSTFLSDALLGEGGGLEYPSVSAVWHSIEKLILKASYFPESVASEPGFQNWVNNLFEFHNETRLRKTRINTANSNTVRKILEIIERRLKHLQENDDVEADGDDTMDAEPLRIVVLGGSITAGVNCDANPLGLNLKQDCTWPSRLEYMFNEGLFGGRKVVKITNMANGGSSTEIGALVMEYQLFPNKLIPHIIIGTFAPNDFQQPDLENVFYEEVQGFLQLAKNVRPCDDNLPLVVIADHMYAAFNDPDKQHKLSGIYATLAAWYDVMAFNHANIARHQLIRNFENSSAIQQLMGSDFNLHMGAGFHIGMAWTALFNFLESFVDTCNDWSISTSTQMDNSNQSHVATVNARIDDVLKGPAVKQISKLPKEAPLSSVVDRWRQRSEEAKSRCSAIAATSSNGNRTKTTSASPDLIVCSHAWMVGKGTGINTRQELWEYLKPVFNSSDGWEAAGLPVRNPRTGWYAQKANATFAMHFPIMEVPVHFLTIVSMKSYGPTWIGSKLKIKVTIDHPSNSTMLPDVSNYEIDGFHEVRTSVHFPHKFELPGNGASVGDNVILEAELVGGSTFKINGIALCRF
jgi:hypothetical protein